MLHKYLTQPFRVISQWIDSDVPFEELSEEEKFRVDWIRILPFIFLHLMCFGVIWVGWSWWAVTTAILLYVVRMFAITAFYHRYFSHKTYKTTRRRQLIFAILGATAVQRGPLWWAAHHRHHHRYADQEEDVHSPIRQGFWWSHVGWIISKANFPTRKNYVRDWLKYPELHWLTRFDLLIPILFAVSLYLFGVALERYIPQAETTGAQMLIWGFFISTVVLFHATATINSLDHLIGSRRYDTPDTSRNNLLLALLTLGEGWHNNHHHYSVSTRQGFYWWEVDITYYLLVGLSWLGIIWDLQPVPERIRNAHLKGTA
ncbi:acyl-CoA desaturase [candidate division KSB3 bacterium]|uniref:Acyl-CoA desaturase n=1 Tax=candidate division KSB3 bacterium TaxID=2044937 RepID=A0A9D5Q7Z3_9BACT|nr:acyl-CoA desaturase [candidate division KSB3 bacterium]MBD3326386.1 acyl-CoA desaturase [candidate division KSB3 bacterium]